MNTFFAELINIAFKIRASVLPEHPLQKAQITLVVNFSTGRKRLKGLYDLDREPVTLIANFANYHLIVPLQAALLKDRQHAIVSNLELVAVCFCELQL